MLYLFILYVFLGASSDASAIKEAMLRDVNTLRQQGCSCGGEWMAPATPVIWNNKLESSASSHANEMQKYNFLDHFSKDGKDIGARTRGHGYDWSAIGENVAKGQNSVSQVVEDWKVSTTHCVVIMNPLFRELGAANNGDYWVLHMGAHK